MQSVRSAVGQASKQSTQPDIACSQIRPPGRQTARYGMPTLDTTTACRLVHKFVGRCTDQVYATSKQAADRTRPETVGRTRRQKTGRCTGRKEGVLTHSCLCLQLVYKNINLRCNLFIKHASTFPTVSPLFFSSEKRNFASFKVQLGVFLFRVIPSHRYLTVKK
jgi:hypothetical protein